ncbi:hypothetical protein ACS0TY_015806 [Phlomoides rotata]
MEIITSHYKIGDLFATHYKTIFVKQKMNVPAEVPKLSITVAAEGIQDESSRLGAVEVKRRQYLRLKLAKLMPALQLRSDLNYSRWKNPPNMPTWTNGSSTTKMSDRNLVVGRDSLQEGVLEIPKGRVEILCELDSLRRVEILVSRSLTQEGVVKCSTWHYKYKSNFTIGTVRVDEPTRWPSTDGTSLEHSPQSVPLHQVSEKSQNYQTGFVMPFKNPGTITPT